mmetsp:Transcript_106800/g.300215  ORF Transcript_106800/g.300215 Transcript_106800/m.300215 type:complete len:333 (-) Transcript_106800:1021-2019(-)
MAWQCPNGWPTLVDCRWRSAQPCWRPIAMTQTQQPPRSLDLNLSRRRLRHPGRRTPPWWSSQRRGNQDCRSVRRGIGVRREPKAAHAPASPKGNLQLHGPWSCRQTAQSASRHSRRGAPMCISTDIANTFTTRAASQSMCAAGSPMGQFQGSLARCAHAASRKARCRVCFPKTSSRGTCACGTTSRSRPTRADAIVRQRDARACSVVLQQSAALPQLAAERSPAAPSHAAWLLVSAWRGFGATNLVSPRLFVAVVPSPEWAWRTSADQSVPVAHLSPAVGAFGPCAVSAGKRLAFCAARHGTQVFLAPALEKPCCRLGPQQGMRISARVAAR